MLYKSSIKHKLETPNRNPLSFEHLEITLCTPNTPTDLLVIYHPPPSQTNRCTLHQFCDEFSSFLEEKVLSTNKLCIVGYFNFHIDSMHNSDTEKCPDILNSFDLQSVNEPTHNNGHTRDLVITRPSDNLIDNLIVKDIQVSDHYLVVHFSILGPKTFNGKITFHKLKSNDTTQFSKDIRASQLPNIKSFNNVDNVVSKYNKALSQILDKLAPSPLRLSPLRLSIQKNPGTTKK